MGSTSSHIGKRVGNSESSTDSTKQITCPSEAKEIDLRR